MKKTLVFFMTLLFIVLPLSAQRRGGDNETGAVEIADGQRVATQGKQWAIFIAIDDYKEWGPLLNPVNDAKELKEILVNNYVVNEVRELYNKDASLIGIRQLLIDLQDKTGPDDSVFIFHAGHGVKEEKTKTSAWIPYDGGEDQLAQINWLSHLQVRSMLGSVKARHVFLITDSCFSGDFLSPSRGASSNVINYPAAYDKVSRQAMSSGASEEVDDVSEFASRLKNTLLRTEIPYITPDYLLYHIKEAKTTTPLGTIPILATIPGTGHQIGGSFLFFRKNPKQDLPEPNAQDDKNTPVQEPALPVPGEAAYFVGSWITTVEHNNSFDTYYITLTANGRCTVKMTNDKAEQETTGNWSWDSRNRTFKLSAVFRDVKIPHMRAIDWTSRTSFAEGSNSFNILAKPTATAANNVRFVFFRD